ncbi:LacI family DNA-binding transcriptional regulator [Streptomyces sp. NPDC060194]|uniref:LacI family DNA-binding transcriptional regulator n=1 Tax=Streptomyces sp. NPDC060194 TaxID=3347069 RepID=UPI0036669B2B
MTRTADEARDPDEGTGGPGGSRSDGAGAERPRSADRDRDGGTRDGGLGHSEPLPHRPTSKDVARAAGVSQASVSLVLGDKWRGRVSADTAERVRAAAVELGYRPNVAARNLRLGSTRTALLVVPTLTNEFFARVHEGAAAVADRHGFGIVVYPSPDVTGRARDPFASARSALDGVIASSMAADALAGIGGGDLPLVMLDSDPDDGNDATGTSGRPGRPRGATVNLDIADGMRQTTAHLLGLGHRRLLHLAPDVTAWTFDVRARELAVAVTATPGATLRTVRAAFTVDAAREAVEHALTAPGPRPTAVVCDDDILAAGACKAVRRLGLRVPHDVSVTGFDDQSLAVALDPELTTVRLPAEQVGERGMTALLALLGHRPVTGGDIPVRLIVRGSTAPPAHP